MASKLSFLIIFLVITALFQPAQAKPTDWPKLVGGEDRIECKEAFDIAKTLFHSDAFYHYASPILPETITSSLVLKPEKLEISGGDALIADSSVFEIIPNPEEIFSRSIYWQRKPAHGLRFVMVEFYYNWRGDQYSLFAVDTTVTPDQFTKAYKKQAIDPLVKRNWRPPLIFRKNNDKQLWAISIHTPYLSFLTNWSIYSIDTDGMQERCLIQFRPEVENAIDLLPKPVRKLAILLDGTLGDGRNEGSLRPTAELRREIETVWANTILRPWRMSKEPYNTREQVDGALLKWARTAPSFNTLHQQIQQQYPKAENALTSYYQTHFNKTEEEAKNMAKELLDIAFRSHYVFSK